MTSVIEQLPEGYSNYLKTQLDPYHDSTIRFEGAPTSRNCSTVTLKFDQEDTFSASDFGIDWNVTPQWDAHFAMYPMLNSVPVLSGNEKDFLTSFVSFSEDTPVLYPMSLHGVKSGASTYMTTDYTTDTPKIKGFDCQALIKYATAFTDNGPGRRCMRIVGASFEVVDETSPYQTQGAVTVYRYPLDCTPANRRVSHAIAASPPNQISTQINGGAAGGTLVSRNINCYDLRSPPSNTAVAVLVPGTKTWKAREGAYVVGTQYVSEVPFKTVDSSDFIFTGYSPSAGTPGVVDHRYSFGSDSILQSYQGYVNSTGFATSPALTVNAVFPYNLSGAYFTGLSSQFTSLRLRYRVYAEILTDPGDNQLAPLSSPSLPYEQALQEYCMRLIAMEEAGVPQTMNPKGEKWKMILRSAAQVAKKLGPVALSAIDPALGAGAAMMIDSVSAIQRNNKAAAKKKNQAKGKRGG